MNQEVFAIRSRKTPTFSKQIEKFLKEKVFTCHSCAHVIVDEEPYELLISKQGDERLFCQGCKITCSNKACPNGPYYAPQMRWQHIKCENLARLARKVRRRSKRIARGLPSSNEEQDFYSSDELS